MLTQITPYHFSFWLHLYHERGYFRVYIYFERLSIKMNSWGSEFFKMLRLRLHGIVVFLYFSLLN